MLAPSAGASPKPVEEKRNVQTDRERVIGRLDDVVHCDVGPGEGAKDGGAGPRRIRGRFELGQGDPLAPGQGSEGRRGPESADLARRSEEHTSELQSPCNLVCRLLLE